MYKELGSRIYYLKSNGNIIYTRGDMAGWVVESTIEEDFKNISKLKEYNSEQVGVIELEYGELHKLMEENKANSYRVDVSEEQAKLIFEWIDPVSQEPTEKPKSEIEKLQEELQNTKLEMSMAIVELTERIMNKDKANEDKSNEELDK